MFLPYFMAMQCSLPGKTASSLFPATKRVKLQLNLDRKVLGLQLEERNHTPKELQVPDNMFRQGVNKL